VVSLFRVELTALLKTEKAFAGHRPLFTEHCFYISAGSRQQASERGMKEKE
jgi:hypothetical protein